jgi:PAS domain S-box-containing protein
MGSKKEGQIEELSTASLFELLISRLREFVVVLCDSEGNFISWHPGVLEQFGYEREEFLGQSIRLLFPESERATDVLEKELETAAKKGRGSDTRMLQRKTGEEILVEGVTIALRDPNGSVLGFGKVLRDVTERKIAEDNLRAMAGALEESTVAVRQWDGTIEHWSAGCARLYGWSAPEAVGKNLFKLLQTEFPIPLHEIRKHLLANRIWQGELQQLRRDGSKVYVSAHWVLVPDVDGNLHSVIETYTDITSRLLVQQELETANRSLKDMALELERSNHELEEFARIASHDLGAPITSTRWLVDLLAARHSKHLDADGQRCLTQVAAGLQRMSDLVDGILAHSIVGKATVRSDVGLRSDEALSAALENLSKHIETAGAVINRQPLPDVYVHIQPLTQLFQNLLSNAIKYRRPEVSLEVNISVERDGDFWRFAVRDNGIGIEADWHERIFQPLQRRHGAEIAGSGIGLATCRKIVSRVGGRIWVESEPGQGSTFFFTLPGRPAPSGG